MGLTRRMSLFRIVLTVDAAIGGTAARSKQPAAGCPGDGKEGDDASRPESHRNGQSQGHAKFEVYQK